MSKFVGKFRKDQDYRDDYESMKSQKGKKVKRRSEHGEIRKLLSRDMQEGYNYRYDEDYDMQ